LSSLKTQTLLIARSKLRNQGSISLLKEPLQNAVRRTMFVSYPILFFFEVDMGPRKSCNMFVVQIFGRSKSGMGRATYKIERKSHQKIAELGRTEECPHMPKF
jgi:hypothetical protein